MNHVQGIISSHNQGVPNKGVFTITSHRLGAISLDNTKSWLMGAQIIKVHVYLHPLLV